MKKSEELKSALKEIGWSYRYCGCDIWNVISCHGKHTDILFDDYSVWIENQKLFGKDSRKDKYFTAGVCKFSLKECEIRIDGEGEFVSVSNNGAFIMFRKTEKN